jgi:hypothetical protein
MKKSHLFAILVLVVMGIGAASAEFVDAAEPALSKAIFYVG